MVENKDLVKQLEEDSLFKLSMSSIELFHSNFWNWMFNKYNESITFFFEDIATFEVVDKVECKREYNNFDIYLEDNGSYYIIENKIKSLPDLKQLEEYTNKSNKKKKFKRGIITSIVKEGFQNLGNDDQWVGLDYEEIADRIKKFHDDYTLRPDYDHFDFELIDRYQNMIRSLSRLVNEELKDGNYYCINSENLKTIKFEVTYKKLIGSILKHKLLNHPGFMKWKPYFPGWKEDVFYEINSTRLTVSIYLQSIEKDIVFGIQINNYEYIWAVHQGFRNSRVVVDKQNIAEEFFKKRKDKYPLWFKNEDMKRFIKNDSNFVYLRQEPLAPGISFDALIQRVIRDIELLYESGYIMKKEK